jgi:long-subunit acyl-CoA synthetase (AMP-forming)
MENSSFCQRVIEAFDAPPGNIAMTLIEPDGAEVMTFGEMLSQIRSAAYRLTQERIAFGDRVALIGKNHPRWAIAYLGVLYRGAVATPRDQAAPVEAPAHFIEDSEAKLAFVAPSSLNKFGAVGERLGRQIPVVALYNGSQANGFAKFEDWARCPRPPGFDAAPPPAA